MEQFAYQIGPEEDDERLDKWMSSAIADLSRSYIQKCIKDNQVLINGKPQKASYRLKVDDEIVFHIPKAMEPAIEAENIPLSILYEDPDLLIVDKPKGTICFSFYRQKYMTLFPVQMINVKLIGCSEKTASSRAISFFLTWYFFFPRVVAKTSPIPII